MFDVAGAADDLLVGFALVVGTIVAGLLFWWLLLPLLLLAVDALVVAVLLVAGGVARVALRRPWTVATIATIDGRRVHEQRVVGWRAARQARDETCAAIARGQLS